MNAVKWKDVLNLRKKARKEWELRRIREATGGDWGQVKKLRAQRNVGWDTHYAEQHPEGEAHNSIHRHLEKIYTTGNELAELPPWEGEAQAFTEEELVAAVMAGGNGKAVGVDQTSNELLRGILDTPGGKGHLLEFYNQILCTAEVPTDWNRAIMVVIPKTSYPTDRETCDHCPWVALQPRSLHVCFLPGLSRSSVYEGLNSVVARVVNAAISSLLCPG